MSRSLEGKIFYTCSNNGVTAIIDSTTKNNFDREKEIRSDLEKKCSDWRDVSPAMCDGLHLDFRTPIFTFAHHNRRKESRWITGRYELFDELTRYIKSEGGRIVVGSFHVPFSNNMETGAMGRDLMTFELSHVTSEQQFSDVFGISIDKLLSSDYMYKYPH